MMRIRHALALTAAACVALVAPLVSAAPAQAAPAGSMTLVNGSNGLLLSTAQDTAFAGLKVTSPNAANSQRWFRVDHADLTFELRLDHNITVPGGGFKPGCIDLPTDASRSEQVAGAKLVIRPCDGTTSQKWIKLNPRTTGGVTTVEFGNVLSGMRMDLNGTTVVQNLGFNKPGMAWREVF